MSYSFKVDTSRQRLIEALEAVSIIEAPSRYSLDQLEVARERMTSHAQEIEAVSMTLRVQGIKEEQFLDYLPTMTPEHVMVEITQKAPGAEVEARQFRDQAAH
ncbi:hypothetical protein [Pseudomonas corrugata]|uniref:hypothetical protein n=1 Tax=Pseudomonas corrugata TaxID=47879 RepID=UPI0006D8B9C5|nr:hypothetical protein [Pseudomonas corrugata]